MWQFKVMTLVQLSQYFQQQPKTHIFLPLMAWLESCTHSESITVDRNTRSFNGSDLGYFCESISPEAQRLKQRMGIPVKNEVRGCGWK
jgi:hypothetical protein